LGKLGKLGHVKMNKTLVIHHSADYDGLFSREIAKRYFQDKVDYLGWDYGQDIPDVSQYNNIYMIDISIDGLMDNPNLTWIDHHKTAIDKFKAKGYQIDGVAASRLAWQYFNHPYSPINFHAGNTSLLPTKSSYSSRNVKEPLSVTLAGEYDIWSHEPSNYQDVTFQFGLDSQKELDWNKLFSDDEYTKKIVVDGAYAQQCIKNRDAEIVKSRSFLTNFEGLNLLCLNAPRTGSNTFAALDKPETGHDALCSFWFDGKSKKWSFSLYHAAHNRDIDLSKIAAKYGGGGHRGACGFRMKDFPFKS
jgi:hypothetical protein